jgi:small-conductance mechanosensitive channel
MSKNDNYPTSMKINYTGFGLAIGLIFGSIIGLVIGNMIIFAGGGLALGLAIGSALDNRSKGSKS